MTDTYWAEREGARWDVYSKQRGWMAQADTEDDARLIVAALTAMQAQQPAALAVPAYYPLGETIYTPPSEEVRFCYSRGQPNNINASRLGEACRRAAEKPGGDYIDGGLSLLKELEARGYGVFRFAKSAHEQAQQPAAAVPEVLCTRCGQPTMHMGSMCYGCTQAAMLAAERKGE